MSILVVCPGCSSKLNAPDTAAGKKVKCPKCQGAVPVPAPEATAFEVVEPKPAAPPESERPTRAASRPTAKAADDEDRPRKRRRDEDEDEDEDERPRGKRRDEDEDDRPRKKGKKVPKAGGVPPVLLFGGIAAAVLAVGFAVYWFGFRDGSGDSTASPGPGPAPGGTPGPGGVQPVPQSGPPEGWKEFASERDRFKAYFPADPKIAATVKSSRSIGGGGQPYYRSYEYRSHDSWADLACTVRVFELPETSTPQQQQTFADLVCAPSPTETGETVTGRGAATLAGVEGKEAVGETKLGATGTSPKTTSDGRPMPSKLVSVNRWIVANNKCYNLKVQGHETRPKEAEAFFDNFALTNPPAPKPKDKDTTPEPKEPPKSVVTPAGWVAYQPVGVGFKTIMPTDIKVTDATTKLPSKSGQPMLQSVKLYRGIDPQGVVCEVRVVQFSPVVQTNTDQTNAINAVVVAPVFEKYVRHGSGVSKAVTWAGKPAREWTYEAEQGVVREIHTATGGFTAAIYAQKGRVDPEKARAFFESFEFTN